MQESSRDSRFDVRVAREGGTPAECRPSFAGKTPDGPRRAFHVMAKPAGAQCNLDCTYCYYLHKETLLAQPAVPRMDDATLAAFVRQYLDSQPDGEVAFSWQGGEPTLMGLPWFERAMALQQQYRRPAQRVVNDLQTNGITLDDDWCSFLARHDFLAGISIDGPAALHDAARPRRGGQPTHARVMQSVELMRRHGVAFNALCVVHAGNARRPVDVYRFLRDEVRPRKIQFIPGVEPEGFEAVAPGTPERRATDWSVGAEDWGYFLVRVWDEWFARDYGRVFVDVFEDAISLLAGRGAQRCVSAPACGRGLALEHDGTLYACDHYVYPSHRLGNLHDAHLGDLAASPGQLAFGAEKSASLPRACRECRYLRLCQGECPRNRFTRSADGEPGLNYLCPGLTRFYAKLTASRHELSRRLGLPIH